MSALHDFQEDMARVAALLEVYRPEAAFIAEAFAALGGAIADELGERRTRLAEEVGQGRGALGDRMERHGARGEQRDRDGDGEADEDSAKGQGLVHAGDSGSGSGSDRIVVTCPTHGMVVNAKRSELEFIHGRPWTAPSRCGVRGCDEGVRTVIR